MDKSIGSFCFLLRVKCLFYRIEFSVRIAGICFVFHVSLREYLYGLSLVLDSVVLRGLGVDQDLSVVLYSV